MNWLDILKRDWKKRQKKAGKRVDWNTEEWNRLREQGEVADDPGLAHRMTGGRRDITGDPEGSGYRDVGAGRTKGTRVGQRAKPPTAISGGGSRSKGKRRKQDLKDEWDAQQEDIEDTSEAEDREIRRENAMSDKQYTAFMILEEYMEVPNGTADQVDEFIIREVKRLSPEVLDALINLHGEAN